MVRIRTFILWPAALISFFLAPYGNKASAASLQFVSDFLSSSAPGRPSNHTIKFLSTSGIPASGKIVITPQAGFFDIPADFDYTDVDLATSTALSGPFFDRALAALPGTSSDGVAIAAGTSGRAIITLSTSGGISAGSFVLMELGSHASYQVTGDRQWVNPAALGSYRIKVETRDSSDALIDEGTAMVAMVDPVTLKVEDIWPPIRSNGQPSGTLFGGTAQAELYLQTDEQANCRYSTAASTTYEAMPSTFSTPSGKADTKHSAIISVASNQSYTFYVRCQDRAGNTNQDDFVISFSVGPPPGPGGTPGGGVPGGGGTAVLAPPFPAIAAAEILFGGWAYPFSEITVLQDGKIVKVIRADSTAKFADSLTNLKQGVYTIGLTAKDTDGRKSITHSTTLTAVSGTKTAIANVLFPPTIELSKQNIAPSETLDIFGQAAPESTVELWIYPSTNPNPRESEVLKKTAAVAKNGRWLITLNPKALALAAGVYFLKGRGIIPQIAAGDFGNPLSFGIGQPAAADFARRADINADGKINLVDFSILLFYWGTSEARADINGDSKVNLTDFSILVFYWTG